MQTEGNKERFNLWFHDEGTPDEPRPPADRACDGDQHNFYTVTKTPVPCAYAVKEYRQEVCLVCGLKKDYFHQTT